MKSITRLSCAILLVATFYACKKDSDKPSPQLSVDRPAISLGVFQGYVDSFEVQSSAAWELQLSPASAAQWMQMSATQGNAGKTIVKVSTIATNATTQTATITVKLAGATTASAEVKVTQKIYTADWQKILGGTEWDEIESMARTPDGGLVIAGTTHSQGTGDIPAGHGNFDGIIVKMTASGTVSWTKIFGGLGSDMFRSIAVTPDGGFIVCGLTESNDNGDVTVNNGSFDLWLLRLDANGTKLWSKCYGGSDFEVGVSVAVTPDGGFVALGETNSDNDGDIGPSNGESDLWVLKLDLSGNIVWSKLFGGSLFEYAGSVVSTTDGKIIVLGSTGSNNTGNVGPTLGELDAWMLKLDATGDIVWNKTFGGSEYDEMYSLAPTPDNGFVAVGYTESHNSGDIGENNGTGDGWVLKIDASGNKVWSKAYGGDDWDEMNHVAVNAEGEILLSGFANSNMSGDVGPTNGDGDIWLLKLNSLGVKIWSKAIGGINHEFSGAILFTGNDEFVIGGNTSSNGTGDVGPTHGLYDFWLTKFK